MGLWETELKAAKIKRDKWVSALDIDGPWEGDTSDWLRAYDVTDERFNNALGTIGGGNHFAELQQVCETVDDDRFRHLGLDKSKLYLLVHSGSRGKGERALREHVDAHGHAGLAVGSDAFTQYIEQHDDAVTWAGANRALIAHRFSRALKSDAVCIFDVDHNTLTPKEVGGKTYWLHRKGASPSDRGPLVIPGSRGAHSYLVEPLSDQIRNAYSLAHGAGRKWIRSDVKGRLSRKYKAEDLKRTELGGVVICENKTLLYEEAPQAYKNIDVVIQDMLDEHLIRVIAVLKPVISYKTRKVR